jgi:hypothetical protein
VHGNYVEKLAACAATQKKCQCSFYELSENSFENVKKSCVRFSNLTTLERLKKWCCFK